MVYPSLLIGSRSILVKSFCSHVLECENCHRMLIGCEIGNDRLWTWSWA